MRVWAKEIFHRTVRERELAMPERVAYQKNAQVQCLGHLMILRQLTPCMKEVAVESLAKSIESLENQ